MSLSTVTVGLSVLLQNWEAPGWMLLLAGVLFAGAGVIAAILLIRKSKK